jgi:hypothetical protein
MTEMAATRGYWRGRPARVAKAVCAVIAAVASACGGGGGDSPDLPELSRDVAQRSAAIALYEAANLAAHLISQPFALITNYGGCFSTGGSLRIEVDGLPLPVGDRLPIGDHAFSASLDDCVADGLAGKFSGTISGSYGVDTVGLLTVSSMRARGLAYQSDLNDVTGNGALTLTTVASGGISTTTATLSAGTTLMNNVSAKVATFEGGSTSYSHDSAGESGQDTFNDLIVVVDGTRYVLDGSLQWSNRPPGFRYESGTVRVTSNGVLHASFTVGQDGGAFVEILVPLKRL